MPQTQLVCPRPRTIETTHSLGRLSLVRGNAQASADETSALVTSLRSPLVSRKVLASLSTGGRGGVSAMKCRTSLLAMCVPVVGVARGQLSSHHGSNGIRVGRRKVLRVRWSSGQGRKGRGHGYGADCGRHGLSGHL